MSMSSPGKEQSVLTRAVETALAPFHAATSKRAQRAYLSTILIGFTSLFLLCISILGSILFYNIYVPQIGVESVMHLQFGNGFPHGKASLSNLISLQPYDVSLHIHLPRTPSNLAVGNFMVNLGLSSPGASISSADNLLLAPSSTINESTFVTAPSRRAVILTYASPLVDTGYKLSRLPWFIMEWKKESEVLHIKMFEDIEFAKGWANIPDEVHVLIEADQSMSFYEARVEVHARFRGLRWMLYNHRIISFLFFTTTFFSVSLASTFLVYCYFTFNVSVTPQPKSEPKIKAESGASEVSTPNPFSTSEKFAQAQTSNVRDGLLPLRPLVGGEDQELREGRPRIKQEHDDYEQVRAIQPLVAEADDEDEGYDEGSSAWRDSGIGTSRDEHDRSSLQRRRRSLHRIEF